MIIFLKDKIKILYIYFLPSYLNKFKYKTIQIYLLIMNNKKISLFIFSFISILSQISLVKN